MVSQAYDLAREELLRMLASYRGFTTNDGAPGGNTLIDTNLIGSNDFITGKTILLESGLSMFESSGASGFVPGTGQITVAPVFSSQVLANTIFYVLNASSAAAVLALIALIKAQTDKLAGVTGSGVHVHANNLLAQIVFEWTPLAARRKVHSIWLDFVNLTQNTVYLLSSKIDAVNYRVFDTNAAAPWTPAMDDGVLIAVNAAIDTDFKLEIQSQVLEGAGRNVPYRVIYEDM
jgi:hypothetical protein